MQSPVMPAWLKSVPFHAVVTLWQALHSAMVGMCFGPLPIACTLLWHVLQVPITFMWLNFASGFQPKGVWHCAQSFAEVMWFVGFALAPKREPGEWQEKQSCGVPLKMPPT